MTEKTVTSVYKLKAMVEALDLLADDDWTPNKKQWERIRSMIETLEEPAQAAPPAFKAPVANGSTGFRKSNPIENIVFPEVPSSIPGNVPVTVVPGVPGRSTLAPVVAPSNSGVPSVDAAPKSPGI